MKGIWKQSMMAYKYIKPKGGGMISEINVTSVPKKQPWILFMNISIVVPLMNCSIFLIAGFCPFI